MFDLPPLPYRYDSLEPMISTKTLRFHHDKHHRAYIDKTNALAAWNHAFFWASMTPNFTAAPPEFAELREDFIKEGETHFASGWVWIVASGGKLKVISTHDADTALKKPGTPLIVCDLWEYAYCLDHQNDRKAYLEAWFDKVANWRFAEKQLRASKGDGQAFAFAVPEDVSAQKRSA